MSSANDVPETWELSGDDAWETLKRTGRLRLARDAFRRFRASDGTSHARSLAFLVALLLVQGIIALVVIASMVHQRDWSELMVNTLQAVAPGPSGKVLTDAVEQAQRAGSSNNGTALLVGLVISSIITACSLLGQVERGLNRLYGIERDRPTLRKYARAFVLSVSAGSLIVAAFAAISLGHVFASSLGSDFATGIWNASALGCRIDPGDRRDRVAVPVVAVPTSTRLVVADVRGVRRGRSLDARQHRIERVLPEQLLVRRYLRAARWPRRASAVGVRDFGRGVLRRSRGRATRGDPCRCAGSARPDTRA